MVKKGWTLEVNFMGDTASERNIFVDDKPFDKQEGGKRISFEVSLSPNPVLEVKIAGEDKPVKIPLGKSDSITLTDITTYFIRPIVQ